MRLLIKSLLFILLALSLSPVAANITDYFSSIKSNPKALYAFFKEMPKGGELHYHLAGGAYPETMLSLAAQGSYCLDNETSSISKSTTSCNGVKSADIPTIPAIYNKTIRAWSMQDFTPGPESGHDHFFASFAKFTSVVANSRPQLLAKIMQRAARQHELYLEIMVLPDNAQSATFATHLPNGVDFTDKKRILLANKAFQNNIHYTVTESTRILQQARQILGCYTAQKQPACGITVKFQYYILREQPLDNLFAQTLNAFAAADQSQDIVAINLVQAEDGVISMRDYQAQMQVIKFMHTVYPNVHIALHAGELSPQTTPPEALRFHIHDAIFTGHAERIGHGVDITHEDNTKSLLKHMATTPVAVEINLTSNREILNITGPKHPLRFYLAHQVPVVLSTDDEGILRTDLTHEYVEAVLTHGLDYPTIRAINRNALTYSFLPGKSLWADANHHTPVPACQYFNSTSCQKFIKNNQKARLQWQLEQKLNAFETQYTQRI